VNTGATAAVCSSLARTLAAIPGGDRTRVALVTFDAVLHFYNLRTASGQPQMCVVRTLTGRGRPSHGLTATGTNRDPGAR
jgi:hypothetical protein